MYKKTTIAETLSASLVRTLLYTHLTCYALYCVCTSFSSSSLFSHSFCTHFSQFSFLLLFLSVWCCARSEQRYFFFHILFFYHNRIFSLNYQSSPSPSLCSPSTRLHSCNLFYSSLFSFSFLIHYFFRLFVSSFSRSWLWYSSSLHPLVLYESACTPISN